MLSLRMYMHIEAITATIQVACLASILDYKPGTLVMILLLIYGLRLTRAFYK